MSLFDFLSSLQSSPPLLIMTLLTLGVILVNGWTDAPNAIATCITTRCMSPRAAIFTAAVCNLAGIAVMTLLNRSVAFTIANMADFGSDARSALTALCAAMIAIVIWACAAWRFGIPTSESHALIAGISGAALAANGNAAGINAAQWRAVLFGLAFSVIAGFLFGFLATRATRFLFRRAHKRAAERFFTHAQIFAGAAMAFMHGAQDGQKFIGVFLLGSALAGSAAPNAEIPVWICAVCAAAMGLGTSLGGKRMIKSVGMDMAHLERYQGFSADIGASACLLICSLFGLPVSTTHTKTTAIMGAGAANRPRRVNWALGRQMAFAWLLTFPGCGAMGFISARILLKFF